MAIPTLAAMAALTLLHNPHAQPEDTAVDYSGFSQPATTIQRSYRKMRQKRYPIVLIQRMARGLIYRLNAPEPSYPRNFNPFTDPMRRLPNAVRRTRAARNQYWRQGGSLRFGMFG